MHIYSNVKKKPNCTVCIIHTDILCRKVQPRTFCFRIRDTRARKQKKKILYLGRNAGISSRISMAGSESETRGGFSPPLSPWQCTGGKSEGWRTDWVYQHGGDQAHLCDVAPD